MKSSSEDAVNDHVDLMSQHRQLVARGPDVNGNIAAGSAASDMASKRAWDFIGFNRRDDIDLNALLLQDISGNPAVAAVVSESVNHENALRMQVPNDASDKLTGQLQQLGTRSAFLLNHIFEANNFFSAQDRTHLIPLLLTWTYRKQDYYSERAET